MVRILLSRFESGLDLQKWTSALVENEKLGLIQRIDTISVPTMSPARRILESVRDLAVWASGLHESEYMALLKEETASIEFRTDQDRRYESYKRGWIVGSSGRPIISETGTEPPDFRDEFDFGFDAGRYAFNEAMDRKSRALKLI